MKRRIRTEEQIIGIVQEHEAGAKCADLCRKHGMSEGTFYAWNAQYSGMTVSEGRHCCAIGPAALMPSIEAQRLAGPGFQLCATPTHGSHAQGCASRPAANSRARAIKALKAAEELRRL